MSNNSTCKLHQINVIQADFLRYKFGSVRFPIIPYKNQPTVQG